MNLMIKTLHRLMSYYGRKMIICDLITCYIQYFAGQSCQLIPPLTLENIFIDKKIIVCSF